MKEENEQPFIRASWVHVLGNSLKVFVEGGVGLFFGSVALVADAAHSIADLLGSLVVLIWGRTSYRKPDRDHPHGHERIEPLTALFVGSVLILVGLKILYDSIHGLWVGSSLQFNYWLPAVLAFAALDMALLYFYTVRVNRSIESPSLHALGRDCLNDLLTTTAAAIGIAGVHFGHPWLDPGAGLLVSLIMVFEGGKIGYENINYLTGVAPAEEKQEEIRGVVYDHPEVRGIHDFVAYYIGPVIEVEMHVEIDGDLTLRQAHDIETDLRRRVLDVPEIYDVHIHLDPAGIGEWKEASTEAGVPDRQEKETE